MMDLESESVEHHGERYKFRRGSNGEIICPVCGYQLEGTAGYPAKALVVDGLICCKSCKTHFGNNDFPRIPPDPKDPLELRHRRLRIAWLDRCGWDKRALLRLQSNLDIDTDQMKRELLDEQAIEIMQQQTDGGRSEPFVE